MEQREMNFFELCVACGRLIGKACKKCWLLLGRMVQTTFQLWWIVMPIIILFVLAGLYYSRQENLNYRVNAVALLNGPTIQQFEQSFAPLFLGQQISSDDTIARYMQDEKATCFALYRVVDCKNDGIADYVDFKGNSSPTDTTKVQMHDRIAIQFCVKERNINQLPEIEKALLDYLNANSIMQQSYAAYIPNLKNEVAFNHSQAVKLDSLTSQYYFNSNLGSKTLNASGDGVAFVGDWKIKLFLNEIYKQQAHLQRGDYRLQLATAPVVLENHFAVDPKPVNGRNKCVVVCFLLGWIIGCALAQTIRNRKSILAWLRQ